MHPTHIVIFGLGGVGGYFGGQLAAHYEKDPSVRISFVARGQHLKAIQEKGLQVLSEKGAFIAHPWKVTDTAADLPKADIVLLAVKTYDLEEAAQEIEPILSPDSWILPLLNGVDNTARLQQLLPDHRILEGLVYVVSYISSPGVITQKGVYDKLEFGSETIQYEEGLDTLEQLFKNAGLAAQYSPTIRATVWEKYLMISSVGSITSFSGLTIGAMRENEIYRRQLEDMIRELYNLAQAEEAGLPEAMIAETLAKIDRFEPEATSSMQRDFAIGKRAELEALTGYVVRASREHGLAAPTASAIYAYLSEKNR